VLDPGESYNVLNRCPDVAERLKAQLEAFDGELMGSLPFDMQERLDRDRGGPVQTWSGS
jgi:hypothetical protein